MVLHNLDIVILIIILASVVISMFRGFIKEALSLVVWVAAVLLALHFCDRLKPYVMSYIHNGLLSYTIAFLIIFAVILIPGIIISSILSSWLSHKKSLLLIDRALGVAFGALRGILIVSIMLILVGTSQLTNTYYKKSTLAPHFQTIESWMLTFVPAHSHAASYLSQAESNKHQKG